MKVVIVEIKDDFVAALSDDGCITKLKNNNYEIGQVITMNKNKMKKSTKFAAIGSVASVAVIGLVSTWAYFTPYAYVSLDVNPSIEYTVNRFDMVLDVEAVNEDGQAILDDATLSDLENKSIEEAVSSTVEVIANEEYFAGTEDAAVIITTSSDDTAKSEELAETIKETVETEIKEVIPETTVAVEAESVGKKRVDEAKALGVTPGKLNLVQKLVKSSPNSESINIEEWLNKPVKDIMHAIKENKKAAKADINEETTEETDATTTDSTSTETTTDVETTEAGTDATTAAAENVEVNEEEKVEAEENEATDADDSEMSKEEKDLAKEAKKLEKQKEQAEKAAEKAKEQAEKEAEKAKEQAEKAAEKAKEQAEKAAEKAKEQAEKTAEKAKKQAEKAADDAEEANDKAEKATEKAKEKANKNKNNN